MASRDSTARANVCIRHPGCNHVFQPAFKLKDSDARAKGIKRYNCSGNRNMLAQWRIRVEQGRQNWVSSRAYELELWLCWRDEGTPRLSWQRVGARTGKARGQQHSQPASATNDSSVRFLLKGLGNDGMWGAASPRRMHKPYKQA